MPSRSHPRTPVVQIAVSPPGAAVSCILHDPNPWLSQAQPREPTPAFSCSDSVPAWLQYGTYVGEVLAPVLVILGLWTRPAALVIAFDLFMAIYLARRGDVAKVNPMSGGWAIELELLYVVGALALALAGGGRYGLGKR